jgi:hypothetical protein
MRARHSRLRYAALLPVLASLLLSPTLARGQSNTSEPAAGSPSTDPAVLEQAKALFLEGRSLLAANQVELAEQKFQESYVLVPRPGSLLNLGLCDERLGRLLRARRRFREVMTMDPGGDQGALAKARLDAITASIPTLAVRLAADVPEGTRVRLDGRLLAPDELDMPRELDPGRHILVAEAPGRIPREYPVPLGTGERASILLSPGPVATRTWDTVGPAAAAPSEEPSETGANGKAGFRTAGLAFGGAGLAVVGVGAVLGGLTLAKKADLQDECPDPARCTNEGVELAGDGEVLGDASTAAFVTGSAALAVGVVLYLVGREDSGAPATSVSARRVARGATIRF